MKNENRLFGWPSRWPSTKSGHFYLVDATWDIDGQRQALDDSAGVLVDASEVVFVEFVKNPEEQNDEVSGIAADDAEGDCTIHRGQQAGQREPATDDSQAKNACAATS